MGAKQDHAVSATRQGHSTYLRTLLLQRYDWMESRVLAAAARNGYTAVTPAMNRLFSHMRARPVGISELARVLGISRQAVHELVRQAEDLKLVETITSEQDARVKLVRFSQAGWMMSDCAAGELDAIEHDLAAVLGQEDLETLRRILERTWSDDEHGLQR